MKEENQSRLEININSQKTSLYFPPDSFLCFLVQEEAVKWVLGDRYFFCKTHLSNIDCNAVIAQLKMMYVDLWWFFFSAQSWLPAPKYELSFWKYSERETEGKAIEFYPLGIE